MEAIPTIRQHGW